MDKPNLMAYSRAMDDKLNPRLAGLFAEYAAYHRHPINRLTHVFAIPAIAFHLIAMLDWVLVCQLGAFSFTLGHLAYVLVIIWYCSLNLRLGIIMALLFGVCFPLGHWTPRVAVVVIAVLAWAIQLAGHVIWEKRAPAFTTNLLQALVGPAFFVAKAIGITRKDP